VRFVVLMAWREVRASWRRLILFFLCIALGVGAMVSLRSFTKVFASSVARDSRMLLSGDVRVESVEPWSAEQIEVLTRHGAAPQVEGQARIIETQTIVRAESVPDARPLMVELRGVDAAFPLRGQVRLADGMAYSHQLLAGRGILVSAAVLQRLGLRVGDRVVIGTLPLTVRGVIERIPGNALNFSPMPRVAVNYEDVEAAGLTGFGSRVRYQWLFKVPDGQELAFAQGIGREYRSRQIRGPVGTFHFVENWLTSSLANIDGFLSLIGLSIVVLGGIGIASVTRVFVQQRVKTVAILKCLGGRSRRVLGAYVAQTVSLAFLGSLFGLVLAQGITSGLAGYASRRLPIDVDPRLASIACIQGVGVGVLIALLFALPPLLDIRDVKPILVLRQDEGGRRRFDWLKIVTQLAIMGAIALLAGWMAGTYRNASLFVGGIAATVVILHVAGTALTMMLSRLRRLPSFVLRQGIGSLYRPGNQTRVTLFTVGLGALFVIAVRLFQVNMQQAYTLDLSDMTADMFFIDVQPGQRDEIEASLKRSGATDVTMMPVSRGRLVGITRHPSNSARVPVNRIGGEYRMTYRQSLDPNETVLDGQFWTAAASREPELSLQEGLANLWMLRIGDALIFDIAGRRIEAKVTSVRRLGRGARTLSYLARADILFRPGTLESLPHTFVGGAKGPADGAARGRLQNDVLSRFPSVTLVDALDDIAEVRKRVADLSAAVSFLGGFVLICGVMILVGSVAMTKMHRLYEAALLKTLGAKRRVLIRITMIEYGVLGLLAGIIGSASSIAVTWGISRFGNRPIPWDVHPWINLIGAAATAVVVVLVGVAATWDVVARKPLGILREQ
jgi:putative ABC transport system permease protein